VPFGNPDSTREPNQYFILDDEVTKDLFMREHHAFSEKQELHSELNAIICLAKNGVSPEGAEMYTTLAPCSNCAKAILAAGIKKLYYMEEYDRSSEGLDLLKEAQAVGKIELEKI
jgi:deoxycytidylate deaminase